MGVVRNFIEIVGIAAEEDLPKKSLGQIIKYDEAEHIFIPQDKSAIKDIYQIAIAIDIKTKRTINTKDCNTVAIDGIKKLKIIYSQEDSPDKMVMLNLQLPFNTFVELPKEAGDIDNISIYILDAYFDLLEKRRVYAHFLYLLDVKYSTAGVEKPSKKSTKPVEILSIEEVDEQEIPQIALSHENFIVIDKKASKEIGASEEIHKENSAEDISSLYL